MRRQPRTEADRGSVLPLVAMGLVLMLVMAAFAVDLGNARQSKGLAQSSTDASALAGAAALAGVPNGSTPPQGGVSQAVWDAASWAFKNLSLTMPAPTTSCGGDANKTCYAASDGAGTVVEVTTPYTTSRLKPDGTAYAAKDVVHVKTCWNNETFIAKVIGIATIRVCSEATAHVIGKVAQNTDPQDEANDPFALCASDTAIFDTGHWFPTNNPAKDIPGKNNYGATYLYTTDLDPTSVVFTIGGDTPFVIGGQPASKVHIFDATSPYVKIEFKDFHNGKYRWELKFTNFTNVDAQGAPKDVKNFKDTLPNGIYAFAVHAKSTDGKCNQTVFSVVVNSSKKASVGPCQEDLFRGGTTPPTGSVIGQNGNRTVTATYYDETPPFVTDSTDANVRSHMMHFEVKGGPYTDFTDVRPDGSGSFTQDVWNNLLTEQSPSLDPSRSHEYKWKQVYAYTIPTTFFNAEYTFRIQVYDSDQNKTGGDCGYAEWTINFQGGAGGVELIE